MEKEKEISFYSNEHGVRITNTRAIIGSTTYSMANITSVAMGVKPANRTPGIAIAICGFIVLLIAAPLESSGLAIFGVILLLIGIPAAIVVTSTYVVRIGSASGEADAISSKEKEYIQTIVDAMNEAFVKRG